jgi:4-carboxymuconolactone decarboxylase
MTDNRTQGLEVLKQLLPGLPDDVTRLRDGGVTLEDIEEVGYHMAGYAGFPAGVSARKLANEVRKR